ncbi:hypothetical protein DEO72_LG3g2192 [Vigna unguiculata]|uniref:Transposase n=1 Tax=Vigna unguiculata TaxID=3917 RepID=A0A4D6LGL4_VIGUN|nr:hypothetical protein DEO72_LG3g2192 [Vigna unguiculata]
METPQNSHDSANDESFLNDHHDELSSHPHRNKSKRKYWMIQVRSEIKQRGLMVKEIYDLPLGDKVVIPFDGNQPSVTNVDGLLRGVLGRLAADSKMFPICFNNWHFGLNNYKNRAWNNVIKKMFERNAENISKLKINHTGGSKNSKEKEQRFCIQELKIEVQELKNQIETKDWNMKTMATLLSQLLRHSSMMVPAELLDVIE